MSDGGREPDFETLAGGDDLSSAERARLEHVHDLLVAAGPPAELPPELRPASARAGATVVPLRRSGRRRLVPAAVVAAALAAVAFGLGFLVGDRNARPVGPERVVAMTGAGGRASLAIFPKDDAGNWPMEMTVRGLPELPEGGTYELWLTKDGRLADRCGTFAVAGARTVVPLNAPYPLRRYDGWVVTRTGSDSVLLTT